MLKSRTINLANPVNRKHPLNIGRVAWYLALPGLMGGAKWHDLMSPADLRIGNHGTLTNITQSGSSGWQGTNRPGGFGHLLFDGVDDKLSVTSNSTLRTTGAFTLSMWVFVPAAPGSFWGVFGHGDGSAHFGMNVLFNSSGQPRFEIERASGSFTTLTGNAAIGRWTNLLGTNDLTTFIFYQDGVSVASGTGSTGIVFGASPAMTIGARQDGVFLSGSVDSVGLWSRSFSAS